MPTIKANEKQLSALKDIENAPQNRQRHQCHFQHTFRRLRFLQGRKGQGHQGILCGAG